MSTETARARFDKYCNARGIVAQTPQQVATRRLMEAAWIAADAQWFRRVKVASMNLCSCGGAGPHDPKACPVCRMYHSIGMGDEE